ncbi:TPA: oligosaccharide flippase family protein [Klebsiella oxytoca]|uniref:oligosaccharide flippase family protein n=1 Tax=Klebsiella oxytoca TaxID=571 RepID=UPI001CCAAF2D|nr:oligosaccharide flippase family protein [Klebsiella oxytoca]EKH6432564.1 oligosaccharide flippase family protein [Klebsiella oxytoca]EKJ7586998.1 oligosaccharide flippase family protein [Klebsiella oxytoca]HBM7345830.1 oligosaccharide flippase family protein [Klebsiella oxytoca]HCC6329076.1 oligosaccharide flippase family protein [Klebsiella oxytoca]HCM6213948.1 oligosaccharide flippase family protein [Klebsiella oxytoca]
MSNSLWMMSEKIVSIFGLIFVTSFVAKYVGPGVFGTIALAMSIFQIVQIVAQLGTDVLIFKRLSKSVNSGVNLINVTVPIRALVYLICSLPVLIYYCLQMGGYTSLYVVAAFLACFIQSMDVYSIYYDATLNSKINTFVNIFGLIASLLMRWLIAYLHVNPLWLCVPIILAALIPCSIRLCYFLTRSNHSKIPRKYKQKYIRYVIGAGSSFVLSSLSVAIYTRLSLIMLGAINGPSAVGVYSVAATLATSWAFILNSFITSTLPSIFSERNDVNTLLKGARLNLLVIGIAAPVIIGVYFLGEWFIRYFYGDVFLPSFIPLIILCFSTLFGALSTVSARIIAKYAGYSFLSRKMLLVALSGFVLNWIFIVNYGIIGAAYANMITQLLSLTFFNYPFKNGVIFKLHLNTILLKIK